MLKRVWREILSGKNIDAYIGVCLAILIIILDIFSTISNSIIQNTLLLLLSLLALGRIIDRWFMEDLRTILGKPEFLTWQDLTNNVQDSIKNSQEIWLIGVAPLGFVREYKDQLIRTCKRRGNVYISFVQIGSKSMKLIASLRPEQQADAKALLGEINDIRIYLGTHGKYLHVRVFDFVPPFIITKVESIGAEIAFITMNDVSRIKLPSQRMSFMITDLQPKSLKYFTDEIKTIWNMGQDYYQS
jgi:hypothetical protein